jgi:hypothetical protein
MQEVLKSILMYILSCLIYWPDKMLFYNGYDQESAKKTPIMINKSPVHPINRTRQQS